MIQRHSGESSAISPVGRGHPGHLGARLDQRPVPLLAAAHRLFGVAPLGHVHGDERDAADATLGVMRREPGERPVPGPAAALPVVAGCRSPRWRYRVPWCAPPRRRLVGLIERLVVGEHPADGRLGAGGQLLGPYLGRQQPRWSAPLRPCRRARLRLTRRKHMSVPKKAKPMGASRSSVARSAESETSMPDIRGCGTDVSVLIAPAPAHERACHPTAPSCSLRTQAGYRHQHDSWEHQSLRCARDVPMLHGMPPPHAREAPQRTPHPRPHRVRR